MTAASGSGIPRAHDGSGGSGGSPGSGGSGGTGVPGGPGSGRSVLSGGLTIAIPTYRRPDAVARAVRGVLAQTAEIASDALDAVEVLVIDNDPSASARSVVTALCAEAPDGVGLRYEVETRPGVAAVRNRALDEAAGRRLRRPAPRRRVDRAPGGPVPGGLLPGGLVPTGLRALLDGRIRVSPGRLRRRRGRAVPGPQQVVDARAPADHADHQRQDQQQRRERGPSSPPSLLPRRGGVRR